eukprot:4877904-Pyramimonas_sp.AAC.1
MRSPGPRFAPRGACPPPWRPANGGCERRSCRAQCGLEAAGGGLQMSEGTPSLRRLGLPRPRRQTGSCVGKRARADP